MIYTKMSMRGEYEWPTLKTVNVYNWRSCGQLSLYHIPFNYFLEN